MREENCMNDIEVPEIEVELVTDGEKELLKFSFEEEISIDLASNNSEQLKIFFQKLLKNIENQDITLKFIETDRKDLFYDVAKKYIEHLDGEIASICSQKLNMVDLEDGSSASEETDELTAEELGV